MSRLTNAFVYLRQKGILEFARQLRFRINEALWERKLGISTAGIQTLKSLGIEGQESLDYMPLGYNALRSGLRDLAVKPGESVFLDYGSGLGRVLCFAGYQFEFRKVVGVEVSEQLARASESNLKRLSTRPNLDFQIETRWAEEFAVPGEVDVISFFNPFRGKTLAAVIERIQESLQANPRAITIAFFNDDDFEEQAKSVPWIRKTRTDMFYPTISFGLYVAELEP